MKCLITGATGFIGRELCPQLLARNHSLVALSNSGASIGDITTTAIDLAQSEVPHELLHPIDVVVHLAGIAHQQAGKQDYDQVNVAATLSLAQRAAEAGVRCFIFLSSVKAMGAVASEQPRDEASCSDLRTPYGDSKLEAELSLQEHFSNSAMSVVILRPALVFGHGAKGNLQRLAGAIEWGLPRPPAVGERSMLALTDLIELICTLVDQPAEGFNTWIVCGNDVYSTRQVYDALRQKKGRGVGAAWLPPALWRLLATLLDRGAMPAGDSTYEKLFGTEVYTSAALQRATGWRPTGHLQQLVEAMSKGVGSADSNKR